LNHFPNYMFAHDKQILFICMFQLDTRSTSYYLKEYTGREMLRYNILYMRVVHVIDTEEE